MKKTKIDSDAKEPQKDLDEFEQFVKDLLSVPKTEVDEQIRARRQKEKEEHQDTLEKKKGSN